MNGFVKFLMIFLITIVVGTTILHKVFKLGESTGYRMAKNTIPTEVWNTIHDSTNTYYIVTGSDSTYSVVFGKEDKVRLPIDSFKVVKDNIGIWIKKPLSQIKN